MESKKIKIRKDFAPLDVYTSLVITTPNSPLMQVYNANNGEFEPDRSITPTILLPQVIANANDGSVKEPYGNSLLSTMKWFVNGVEISTLSDWKGLYEINQTNSILRGALTIKRNVFPNELFSLRFSGVISDMRLGVNLPIDTEEVILSTTDQSKDNHSISIGEDTIIRYNPFKDKLLEYDYKVAHNIISHSTAAQKAATDTNSYLRTIAITIMRGNSIVGKSIPVTGYAIKLFKINSVNSFTEILPPMLEIMSVSMSQIELDLRLASKTDYMIKIYYKNEEVASLQFSINRIYPKYNCTPSSGASILPSDKSIFNIAIVMNDANIIPYPETLLNMIWKTDTYSKTNVKHNEGSKTIIDLNKTGIGSDYTNDWISIYIESSQKAEFNIVMDNNNTLTNENNEILIIN